MNRSWYLPLLCKAKAMQPMRLVSKQTLLFASLLVVCGAPATTIPTTVAAPPPTPAKTVQLRPIAKELRQNRRRWAAQNIANYRYTLQINCFCLPEVRQPVVIEVRNGKRTSITPVQSGLPVNASYFRRYDTIPKLFNVIQAAINDKADSISVTYDPALGYPTQISIDPEQLAADEEIWLTINNFQIIK